jgi:uncharacterized phage protein (TIGR01671 family)
MSKPTNLQQREIKFRAWDGEHMIHDIGIRSGMALHLDTGKMHDWPLMQHTGLNDKDGREIYEGDVVKTTDSAARGGRGVGYVAMNEGSWRIAGCYFGYYIHPWSNRMEVIGNIYENPELTKP